MLTHAEVMEANAALDRATRALSDLTTSRTASDEAGVSRAIVVLHGAIGDAKHALRDGGL